jgi:hypothetical protein
MAASMKMTVFSGAAPCSLRKFTGVSNVIAAFIIVLKMEAASTFETSVNFYQTTRRNTPEDLLLSVLSSHNLIER